MKTLNEFTTINFTEHPYLKVDTPNDLAIVIEGKFTPENYAQAVFSKILNIGLSEIPHFLTYHCEQLRQPVLWLNQLEKLIKENIDHFSSNKLKHRHTKLITQIELKRFTLSGDYSYKKAPSYNGILEQKEFNFNQVKDDIKSYETPEEKIHYLEEQIIDYQQNPPMYVSVRLPPFDKLCEMEIDRIRKAQTMKASLELRKATQKHDANRVRRPYNGSLKLICDVYFKMMNHKTKDGAPILPWTIKDAVDHICASYCEPDGSAPSPSTVRTYLSPSKPENRPKRSDEIRLDDIL